MAQRDTADCVAVVPASLPHARLSDAATIDRARSSAHGIVRAPTPIAPSAPLTRAILHTSASQLEWSFHPVGSGLLLGRHADLSPTMRLESRRHLSPCSLINTTAADGGTPQMNKEEERRSMPWPTCSFVGLSA